MALAFLDIETSWEKTITVIGVYRPGEGTTQLVAPEIRTDRLLSLVQDADCLFTYNGGRFDLPVIQAHLGVDLARQVRHRDLMFDCWKKKLKGGLKAVERRLGIHRDSEGVDGLQAMNLWKAHQRACATDLLSQLTDKRDRSFSVCCEPMEILLRYNREDCENLEILASKLGVLS